jgi:hypothetical protein
MREQLDMKNASGLFDVTLTPQTPDGKYEDAMLGRFTIDKHYQGDLEATGVGQMLTGGTRVRGSAGYVAIERVSGTLHGKRGSFVLQHIGTMSHGDFRLSVTVIPDSGTDELTGITGSMNILVVAKKHSYKFDYTLGAAK